MEEQKARLRDAFGESSDSESEPQEAYKLDLKKSTNFDESGSPYSGKTLTGNESLKLMVYEGWFTEVSHNEAMRFGDLSAWATEISSSIKEVIQFSDCVSEPMGRADCDKDKEACLFPSDLLWRDPLLINLL